MCIPVSEVWYLNEDEIEEIPCALCGSQEHTVLFTSRDTRYSSTPRDLFSMVACAGCGLRFLSPRPVESALMAFYPEEYIADRPADPTIGRQESSVINLIRRIRPPRRVRKLKEKFQLVRRLVSTGASILEIGPGGGDFLALLKSEGYDVQGMDINPGVIARIQNEVGVPGVLDVEADEKIAPGSKDLIVLWNALEHIPDPNRLLNRISRWLRSDGYLLLSVPNATALERSLFFTHSSCEDIPRHLYSYSPGTLTNLLQTHGFSGVKFKHNTLCSTSELQQVIEDRYISRSGSIIIKALGFGIGLPLNWVVDRIFAIFGRSHTFVAWAKWSEVKNESK